MPTDEELLEDMDPTPHPMFSATAPEDAADAELEWGGNTPSREDEGHSERLK